MLIQKLAETSSCRSGETTCLSKLLVVRDSILTWWEQGGRLTQPFPLTCVESKDLTSNCSSITSQCPFINDLVVLLNISLLGKTTP